MQYIIELVDGNWHQCAATDKQETTRMPTCQWTCRCVFLTTTTYVLRSDRSRLLQYKTRPSFVFPPRNSTYQAMKRAADTEVSLPSPPAESSQSPEPSDEFHAGGPPRKRSRSETSPEERKEARAHRNRIAAQNSRDRRKAQFAYLEHRVAELEEENRQLRAGMGLMGLRRADEDRIDEQREKDKARDVENEELRERIRTLEAGWDAVVKALAASGLPLNIPSAPPPPTTSSSSSTRSSSQPPTTAFPVLVPPSPVSVFTTSPSLSESCSPSSSTKSFPLDFDSFASTRHLARVATTDAPPLPSVSLQRVDQASYRIPTTFNLSSSSTPLPQSLFQRQVLKNLHRPWTKLPWKIFSARSLRHHPHCRRRLFLHTLPLTSPGPGPTQRQHTKVPLPVIRIRRPRPPGRRRQ